MADHKFNPDRRTIIKSALIAGAAIAAVPGQVFSQGIFGLVTKAIPSSGERVPLIGVGTARRYDVAASAADLAPLHEVIVNMPRVGCSMIDTAPSYGNAETVVGNLLREIGNRDEVFIATKVRQANLADARAEIEASFEKLGVEQIDLLQVHNLVGIRELLPYLRDLKTQGRIRYYGMTTSSANQYEEFERILASEEMDFIQIDYAIDNRNADQRILPLARDRGVAVQTNLPFGRGRVFEAFGEQSIPQWAADYDINSWAQFALKYLVSHPAVTCAMPGTARLAYLEDNMQASIGRMPDPETRQRMADLVDAA